MDKVLDNIYRLYFIERRVFYCLIGYLVIAQYAELEKI